MYSGSRVLVDHASLEHVVVVARVNSKKNEESLIFVRDFSAMTQSLPRENAMNERSLQ